MTRLNDKIARLEAFKEIIELVNDEIKSSEKSAEEWMKNHTETPDHPYYAEWAFESRAKAKRLENAINEIIELAVSK